MTSEAVLIAPCLGLPSLESRSGLPQKDILSSNDYLLYPWSDFSAEDANVDLCVDPALFLQRNGEG